MCDWESNCFAYLNQVYFYSVRKLIKNFPSLKKKKRNAKVGSQEIPRMTGKFDLGIT